MRIAAVAALLFAVSGLLVPAVMAQPEPPAPAAVQPPSESTTPAVPMTIEPKVLTVEQMRAELRSFSEAMPRRLAELSLGEVTPEMVEQARLDARFAKLQVKSLGLDLTDGKRRIGSLGQTIQALEAQAQWLANPVREEAAVAVQAAELKRAQQALAQQRLLLEQAKSRIERVQQYAELAQFRSKLTDQWLAGLTEAFRSQQEQQRISNQAAQEERLQAQQQTFLVKALAIRQSLSQSKPPLSEADRQLLEMQLKFVEARARFVDYDIRLTGMQSDLLSLEELAVQPDASPESLQDGLRDLGNLLDELNETRDLFDEALLLVEQQKQLFEQHRPSLAPRGQVGKDENAGAKGIAEMVAEIQRRQQWAERLSTKANALKSTLAGRSKRSLRSALTGRSYLPAGSEEWRQLLEHLADAPGAVLYQVTLSVKTAFQAVVQADPVRWKLLAAAEVMLLALTAWFGRLLERGIHKGSEPENRPFIGQALLALLQVLRNNLIGVGLVAGLLVALWITQVPQPGQGILAAVSMLWIGIKMFLSLVQSLLAWLHLSAEQQRHSNVLSRLRWVVVGGGLLGSVVLLTHLSSLPADVSDALDRVFMLYLLLAFPVLLQLRQFLVDLLRERYAQRLWFSTLRVATLLLPLALIGAGLLGLVGYLDLAWAFAWYLGMFLLVMVGWQVMRGVLNDVVVFLKNFAVTHSAYGLLWTQDIIAPLHRVAEVALIVAAGLMFLGFYDLQGDSTVFGTLRQALEKSVFSVGGTVISWADALVIALMLFIVLGLGRWVRGITYRWVFLGIHDLGVRHSLSVFLQYAIVLIGALIVLRLIGLDLTTFAVFAGAVGVGIGFGLKEIANNLVSGLLLLLERPLRSGDIVKIGDNEGMVSAIGTRAVTMKTFDNMEVIIPNSEVVSKSFTNWTHSDTIVRTVLWIGVSYDAEPERAKDILEEVIVNHPAIVGEPPPWVLLWEFSDSAIQFRVQYYVDVNHHSLLTTRSEVNFAIWQALKKAGIPIPYPQHDLYIKEWPVATRESKPSGTNDLQQVSDVDALRVRS